MSDQPLDNATLEALRAVMTASDLPAIDPQTWGDMLRRVFDAPKDEPLHGDVSGEDLLPPEWPASTDDDMADGRADPTEEADDGDDAATPFHDRGWSGDDPSGGLVGGEPGAEVRDVGNADDEGGDLT